MDPDNIFGTKPVDLALMVEDYLVISDIHLGYEQSLNAEGIMVPRFQYPLIIDRLENIKKQSSCDNLVVNGDLKHEFGKITRQEWSETMDFLDFLKDNFEDIILIRGNHDNFTQFIAQKTDLEVEESFQIGASLIAHGDKIVKDVSPDIETLIIGHEHPCLGLRSGERLEKIKCYLAGSYNSWNLVVMPSFNFVTEGSDILHEKPLSPYLQEIPGGELEVFAVENFEVFPFGKVKDIMKVREKFY